MAEKEGKITKDDIVQLCHTNPAKIFNIQTDDSTYVEVSEGEYEIRNEDMKTKCGWTPFAGMKVPGRVERVFIRGEKVYENGEVLAKQGSGRIL